MKPENLEIQLELVHCLNLSFSTARPPADRPPARPKQNLKYVSDKFNDAAGDERVRRFAKRLDKSTQSSDLAVRLGSDEFLLVLPECQVEDVQRVPRRSPVCCIAGDSALSHRRHRSQPVQALRPGGNADVFSPPCVLMSW